jgi:ABC-2 type transport system permease protein
VLDLVFSRPIGKRSYTLARFVGIAAWLGVIIVIAGVLTWASLWIVQSAAPSLADVGHLATFFVVSWLFLLPFTALGMMSGMYAKQETTAMLLPILVWVLFTFVVPQLGTAEEPISFLNPVPAQPASQGVFFEINRQVLQPLSFTDHYKELSSAALQYTSDHELVRQGLEFTLIIGLTVVPLVVFSPQLIRQGELYE